MPFRVALSLDCTADRALPFCYCEMVSLSQTCRENLWHVTTMPAIKHAHIRLKVKLILVV